MLDRLRACEVNEWAFVDEAAAELMIPISQLLDSGEEKSGEKAQLQWRKSKAGGPAFIDLVGHVSIASMRRARAALSNSPRRSHTCSDTHPDVPCRTRAPAPLSHSQGL